MFKPRLVTYGGDTVLAGDAALLDGNFPVTVMHIRSPYDDDDNGAVAIRFEWGATETVDPVRLGAYFAL